MKLDNLLNGVDLTYYNGSLDRDIYELCTDSRKAVAGSLYVTLPGTKTDGQNFISQVLEKGTKVILCDAAWLKNESELKVDVTYLGVPDRRKAFAAISANFYGNPTRELFMIGVTGTNGKTTSTHLIENILQENGAKTGIMGTLYARYADVKQTAKFTTPMADELQKTFKDMLEHGVDSVVMEVSSHALEQYRVGACEFSLAAFTNLTQDHLDYHPTFEDYKQAKAILFRELLKPDGAAVINIDDPSASFFIEQSKAKVITYGLSQQADVYAADIVLRMDGTGFTAHTPSGKTDLHLNLVGKFNVYNALTALACAEALNIPLEISRRALEKSEGIPGRIEMVTPKGHLYTVVVDYAHTPDSLENVLKTAREFTTGRLITVFGCGGDRDKTKRPVMGGIGARLSDFSVITSDNPRTEEPTAIIENILQGVPQKESVIVEADRKEAIRKAIELAQPGDTVVIAGKGHEDYQIFKDKTIHFDDREVAREFIK
jgi:UDP-N-acetylmuramoyl-L-alanyl-D-glutamate--2,6-diaminopimelate ligase